MELKSLKIELNEYVVRNEFGAIFKLIRNELNPFSKPRKQFLLIESRYKRILDGKILKTEANDEIHTQFNNLSNSILLLIDEISEKDLKPTDRLNNITTEFDQKELIDDRKVLIDRIIVKNLLDSVKHDITIMDNFYDIMMLIDLHSYYIGLITAVEYKLDRNLSILEYSNLYEILRINFVDLINIEDVGRQTSLIAQMKDKLEFIQDGKGREFEKSMYLDFIVEFNLRIKKYYDAQERNNEME